MQTRQGTGTEEKAQCLSQHKVVVIPGVLAPSMSPYFPAGQLLQFAIPSFAEYVPRGHGLQLADELAPNISENFPARHGSQMLSVVAPRISEYVATGQGVHTSEIAPIWSEYFPAAHEMHAVEAFEWLYFPSGHRMQGEVPRTALYLPRTQWKHSFAYAHSMFSTC
jgi:hypothetical protein